MQLVQDRMSDLQNVCNLVELHWDLASNVWGAALQLQNVLTPYLLSDMAEAEKAGVIDIESELTCSVGILIVSQSQPS